MDISIGDEFSLVAALVDVTQFDPSKPNDPSAIQHPKGTRVKVTSLKDGLVQITFPNGDTDSMEQHAIWTFFRPVRDGEVALVQTTTAIGTPPPELASYLPRLADWRKNYKYSVRVELIDRGLKTAVCPSCLGDLGEDCTTNEEGKKHCAKCGTFVEAIDPKQFGDLDENESGEIFRSG